MVHQTQGTLCGNTLFLNDLQYAILINKKSDLSLK